MYGRSEYIVFVLLLLLVFPWVGVQSEYLKFFFLVWVRSYFGCRPWIDGHDASANSVLQKSFLFFV